MTEPGVALSGTVKWIFGISSFGVLFLVLGIVPPVTAPLIALGILFMLPGGVYAALAILQELYKITR